MNAFVAAVVALASPLLSKTSDLAGIWEGLSACADKIEFPTVRDEQWVCHVTAKDARTVMVQINKIVNGKEEAMSPEPAAMVFDAKTQTLTAKLGGRKPSTWVFHLTYSTWVGTAKGADGRVFRHVLVKRR